MTREDTIAAYDVTMPAWKRRLALLTVGAMIGAFVAYIFPPMMGLPVIVILAITAGISTMWSP